MADDRKPTSPTSGQQVEYDRDHLLKSLEQVRQFLTERDQLRELMGAGQQPPRSRTDLALAVSAAAVALGLLAVLAGGFYSNNAQLGSIHRELGGLLVKNEEVERRLTRLEEGQSAIQTALADMSAQFGARLDAIDARLGTLDQTIKGIQDRAALEP